MKLGPKLILLFLAFGIIPLVISSAVGVAGMGKMANTQLGSLESSAETIVQRIERNLFERYGDVQAFGLNEVVLNQDSWYKQGKDNKIVEAMNKFMSTYTPIYEMMMFVDTEGKVIAVSSNDFQGKPAKTDVYYGKNYAKTQWFQKAMAGKFLEGEGITGTYVEDADHDEVLGKTFGTDGTTISYSAPVKDAEGKVIGVWHNYARMALVESIVQEGYAELKKSGFPSGAIRVTNADGVLLSEYDPKASGTSDYKNDPSRVLQAKLTEEVSFASAMQASKGGHLTGQSGKRDVAVGFKKSEGALGYPGLGWNVVVEVPSSEFFAGINSAKRIQWTLLIATLVIIVGGAWFYSRSIVNPLTSMVGSMQKVAQGSVNLSVDYESKDELGQVATALRGMIGKIRDNASYMDQLAAGDLTVSPKSPIHPDDVMASAIFRTAENYKQTIQRLQSLSDDVRATSGEVAHACTNLESASQEANQASTQIRYTAEEVAKASQDVAHSSERQAHELIQVSDSMGRISQAVQGVRDSVDEMATQAQNASKTAEESGAQVAQSLKGMGTIQTTTAKVAASLRELDDRSQRIGTIASTIDEISEQTNLLALNAAIEAARAGEHGRGFAVVAEEVRKLAEHAASATGEITTLIEQISKLVQESNSAMDAANKAVLQGMELSDGARESLDEIVNRVAGLQTPVKTIVGEAAKVADLAAEVSMSVDTVSHGTQSNSAAAEEMSASVEGVSDQVADIARMASSQSQLVSDLTARATALQELSDEMAQIVRQFKINDGSSGLRVAA